ncbi:hypothetical protein HRbin09_00036 [bacterium HR09]|nr:hypothetical protein HRbin09_00036 [bacterium HR09]
MRFFLLLVLALAAQAALTSHHLPWLLSSLHVWLVVVVGRAQRFPASHAGWFGLLSGLAADAVRGWPWGPSGIASAVAGAAVALASVVFDLSGPLFWVVGTLLASGLVEGTLALVYLTLGARPPHGWVGAAAAVAGTTFLGFLTAASEWWWGRVFSPQARRRRALRRR